VGGTTYPDCTSSLCITGADSGLCSTTPTLNHCTYYVYTYDSNIARELSVPGVKRSIARFTLEAWGTPCPPTVTCTGESGATITTGATGAGIYLSVNGQVVSGTSSHPVNVVLACSCSTDSAVILMSRDITLTSSQITEAYGYHVWGANTVGVYYRSSYTFCSVTHTLRWRMFKVVVKVYYSNTCGNSIRDSGENCDVNDGIGCTTSCTFINGYGCDSNGLRCYLCSSSQYGSNGVCSSCPVNSVATSDRTSCTCSSGWQMTGSAPSWSCIPILNDNKVVGTEQCDNSGGTGCASGRVVNGYFCQGALLTSVTITGTAGQFACAATSLAVGQTVVISGTYGGTGSISGYSSTGTTTYYIITTNGSTSFTLSTTSNGSGVTTTAGTPTGLTYQPSIFTGPSVCTLLHFSYGSSAGDTLSSSASSVAITLPSVRFFGTKFTTAYLNKNGVISFGTDYGTWSSSTSFATHTNGIPLIAGMWSSWSWPCGSGSAAANVYHRFGSSGEITDASTRVRNYFGLGTSMFTATGVLIVTYLGDTSTCDGLEYNYFQVVLAYNSIRTYVLQFYGVDSLRWYYPAGTTGVAGPLIGVSSGTGLYRSYGLVAGTEMSSVSNIWTGIKDRVYIVRADALRVPYEPNAAFSASSRALSITATNAVSWSPAYSQSALSTTFAYTLTFNSQTSSTFTALPVEFNSLISVDGTTIYEGEGGPTSSGYFWPRAALSGVVITGTTGQFSCSSTSLAVGQAVVISGTYSGTGSISGYVNPTTYYIITTNGSTTFTLSTTSTGSGVTTTAGTPAGITYTMPVVIVVTPNANYWSWVYPTFTGWTSVSTSMCGSYGMMGGYGLYGVGATSSYTFTNLAAGQYVLTFDYYHVDSWDGEQGRATWNGVSIWSRSHSMGGSQVCGGGWGESNGLGYARTTVVLTHSGGNGVLQFSSTLDQGSADESWGVNNIAFGLSSTTYTLTLAFIYDDDVTLNSISYAVDNASATLISFTSISTYSLTVSGNSPRSIAFTAQTRSAVAKIQCTTCSNAALEPRVITGVAITGSAGQFSCTYTLLAVGETLTITGTWGGTGSISGYVSGNTYYIISTNGSTTFTLSSTSGGSAVTTTAGTPTGLTYTYGPRVLITGTAGQFSCGPTQLAVGQTVVISGTYGGTGSISGYSSSGTTYYIIATNGSTTFTLSTTSTGSGVTTTAGTPTGLAFRYGGSTAIYTQNHPGTAAQIMCTTQSCNSQYDFKVTAENGRITTYSFTATRSLSADTTYSGSVSPTASPGGSTCDQAYGNLQTTTSITITTTNANANCSFTGYPVNDARSCSLSNQPLVLGVNNFPFSVTAENKAISSSYVYCVNRVPSNVKTLSSLTITENTRNLLADGPINGFSFSSSVYTYTVDLDASWVDVTFVATRTDADSSIVFNDVTGSSTFLRSGDTSSVISLRSSTNYFASNTKIIQVRVTAQDLTTQDYTLTLRAGAVVNRGQGTLSTNMCPTTNLAGFSFQYSVTGPQKLYFGITFNPGNWEYFYLAGKAINDARPPQLEFFSGLTTSTRVASTNVLNTDVYSSLTLGMVSRPTLSGVTITGTAGQFSCSSTSLAVGQPVYISGTYAGSGSISGYSSAGTTYYIITTNGSTTFTLSTTTNGSGVTTTVGTPSGLTYRYAGMYYMSVSKPPVSTATLTSVVITGTAGQFSCAATSFALAVGQTIYINGVYGGTGSITGHSSSGTTYYIIATNGSTTFTLSRTSNGSGVVTTAGTPTGLTYAYSITYEFYYCLNNFNAAVKETTVSGLNVIENNLYPVKVSLTNYYPQFYRGVLTQQLNYPSASSTQSLIVTGYALGASNTYSLVPIDLSTRFSTAMTTFASGVYTVLVDVSASPSSNSVVYAVRALDGATAQTNGQDYYTFSARVEMTTPSITSITPSLINTAGTTTVTITGTYFEYNRNGLAVGGSISIGGATCSSASYSAANIVCLSPAGEGVSKSSTVTITCATCSSLGSSQSKTSSAYTGLSYIAPSITSISTSATRVTGGGFAMTLTGTNFGQTATVTVNSGSGYSGPATCTSPVISGGGTQLVCTAPAGSGVADVLIMVPSTSGQTSSIPFTYAAPVISSYTCSGNCGTRGGGILTLTGTNFGSTASLPVSVTVNAISCSVTAVNSHTQIQCTLPAGSGVNKPIVVTVDGQNSNSFNFAYTAPAVTSFTPPTVPATGGTITLSGTNFGGSGVTASVSILGGTCSITTRDHETIQCTAPSRISTLVSSGTITVDGQSTATPLLFYTTPAAVSINPTTIPTAGQSVTLTGTNMASPATSIVLDGVTITPSSSGDTSISFAFPAGAGTSHALYVAVAGYVSNTLSVAYTAPVLSSITFPTGVNNPVPDGTTAVTLTGTNFGPNTLPGTVAILSSLFSISSWSHTQLVGTFPQGSGTVTVTVTQAGAGAQSSSISNVQYAAPIISSISPSTVPTSGGSITIVGSNFYVITGSVTLDNNPVTVSTWSRTSIVGSVGVGRGTNLPVVVTEDGRASSAFTYGGYASPSITSITASSFPTAGNVPITINGASFDTATGGSVAGSVTVNSNNCPLVSWGHSAVVCTLPAGTGANRAVVLTTTTNLQASSTLSYGVPVISRILNSAGLDAGAMNPSETLTIQGSGFGSTDSAVSVSIDSAACTVVSGSVTETAFRCTTDAYMTSQNPQVVVTVSSVSSNAYSITLTPPTITGFSPPRAVTGPSGTTLLTVTGSAFGDRTLTTTVSVGGTDCPITSFTAQSGTIVCTLPIGLDQASVRVVVGSQSHTFGTLFQYDAPTISGITTSASYPCVGGVVVTVAGTSFGASGVLTVAGITTTTSSWSHTQVIFTLPAGSGSVTVTVTSGTQSGSRTLTYTAPSFANSNAVTPAVNTDGSQPVTINGVNFGTSTSYAVVTIDGRACAVISCTDARIVCNPAAASGAGLTVSVTINGLSNSNSATYAFADPSISSITKANGSAPTSGGSTITISGSNFGNVAAQISIDKNYPTCDYNSNNVVYCSVRSGSWTHSSIQCTLPEGIATYCIRVEVTSSNTPVRSSASSYSYNLPVITSVSPSSGPTSTSSPITLTVTGSDFSTSALCTGFGRTCSLQIYGSYFDPAGVACGSFSVQTHTRIECQLPEGNGGALSFQPNIGGQQSSSQFSGGFTYTAPSITGIEWCSSGGTLAETDGIGCPVTITGTNFGSSSSYVASSPTVTTYPAEGSTNTCDTACQTSYSHTQIIIPNAPAGVGRGGLVSVRVGGQNSASFGFSYKLPVVSGIDSNGVCSNDASTSTHVKECPVTFSSSNHVRITGSFFGSSASLVTVVLTPSGNNPTPTFISGSSIVSVTDTAIVFALSSGTGLSWVVSVRVGGSSNYQTSVATNVFLSYRGPVINSISATGGLDLSSITSSTQITLTGQYFEDPQTQTPQTPAVSYGPTASEFQATIISASDTEIICTLSQPSVGARLYFKVHERDTNQYSPFSSDYVSMPNPTLVTDSIDLLSTCNDPSTAVTGTPPCGTQNSVSGSSGSGEWILFRATNIGSNVAFITIKFDYQWRSSCVSCPPYTQTYPYTCTSPTILQYSGDETAIKCLMPAGLGHPDKYFTYKVVLFSSTDYSSSAVASNGSSGLPFSYSYPQIPLVFGVRVDPTFAGISSVVITGVAGQFACTAASLAVGQTVTISGTWGGTGSISGYSSGTVYYIIATDGSTTFTLSASDNGVGVTTTAGTPTGLTFSTGCTDSGNSSSSYRVTNCRTIGGVRVRVHGAFFSNDGSTTVLIKGVSCTDVYVPSGQSNTADMYLTCLLPSLVGNPGDIPILVTSGTPEPKISASTFDMIGYAAPFYTRLQGCTDDITTTTECDRFGWTSGSGQTLTITGTNFGSGSPYVFVGGITCTNAIVTSSQTQNEITCRIPAGVSLTATVLVMQNSGRLQDTASATLSIGYAQCQSGTYEASNIDYACTSCQSGRFSSASSAVLCLPCVSGTYSSSGASLCSNCPAGQFSTLTPGADRGPTACTACQAGTYSPVPGVAICEPCPLGTSGSEGAVSCSNCATGRYADTAGNQECTDCAPGSFGASTGQASCVLCDKGSFSGSRAVSCTACQEGRYAATTGSVSCTACALGRAQPQIAQDGCLECDSGTFSNDTALADCYTCQPGFVSRKDSLGNGAQSCTGCLAGYYMPVSSQLVCLSCPFGKYVGTANAHACLDCAVGAIASTAASISCTNCLAGTVAALQGSFVCESCALGRAQSNPGQGTCDSCSAGTYADSVGTANCPACALGSVAVSQGQGSCALCGPGFQRSSSDIASLSCVACAVGRYTPSVGTSECTDCAPGTFTSTSGQATCPDCPVGTFAASSGTVICTACATGRYTVLLSGNIECTDCPTGTFGDALGSGVCQDCSKGTFTDSPGSTICTLCATGRSQANDGAVDCDDCAIGSYVGFVGQAACIACPVGKSQSSAGRSACDDCIAGTIQDIPGSVSCTDCSAGRYNPVLAQASCVACAAGSFSNSPGAAACTSCATGTFCDRAACQSCATCSVGTFSSSGAVVCSQCEVGSYIGTAGESSCTLCPAGKYQPQPGASICLDCAAGSFQATQGQPTCDLCPVGTWSESDAASCTACLIGQFQSQPGQTGCIDCAVGYYSPVTGLSECTICPMGTFAESVASTECTSCPTGYVMPTPGAGSCNACAAGSKSQFTGGLECVECSAGTYQDASGQSSCVDCPIGSYCIAGAPAYTPCAAGTVTAVFAQSSCLRCVPGTFAPSSGLSACTNCLAGTYANLAASTACTDCAVGHFSYSDGAEICTACDAGSFAASVGLSRCTPCPAGQVQPSGGRSDCNDCQIGTFSSAEGLQVCTDCNIGFYASSTQSTTCLACPMGSVQPQIAQGECNDCLPGQHMSSVGQALCVECDPGFFANETGLVECYKCQSGTYSVLTSNSAGAQACTLCSPGQYALADGQDQCFDCPLGRFTNEVMTVECSSCDVGRFTGLVGLSTCSDCATGYFTAVQNSYVCLACLAGKFAAVTGFTGCLDCDAGTQQPDIGQSSCDSCAIGKFAAASGTLLCEMCAPGDYMPTTSSISCLNCAPGSYQPQLGQADCIDCDAGSSQIARSQVACDRCEPGRFAGSTGASTCIDCPVGTSQSFQGSASCTDCDIGYYTAVTGQLNCLSCPSGAYTSLTRQNSCIQCDPGRAQNSIASSSCLDCSLGQFQVASGQSICLVCESGKYSNTSATITCIDCQTGQSQPLDGQTGCTDCAAGTFSGVVGANACDDCIAGTYSIQGETQCTDCSAGYFQSATQQSSCDECPVGQFTGTSGQSECEICAVGFSNPILHASQCVQCDPGKYQDNTGMSRCTDCEAGYFQAASGQTICLACETGRFNNQAGLSLCDACNVGTYADAIGSIVCRVCAPGKYVGTLAAAACINCVAGFASNSVDAQGQSLSSTTTCFECIAGKFSRLGAGNCLTCAAGYFSMVAASVACTACDAGSYSVTSTSSGATSCSTCPEGRSQPLAGQSSCNDCDVGLYNNQVGQSECLPCAVGYYTGTVQTRTCIACVAGKHADATGSSMCSDCSTGKYSGSNAQRYCSDCLKGTFNNELGLSFCRDCPVGKYNNVDGRSICEVCFPGSYNDAESRTYCTLCENGKYQDGLEQTTCIDCARGKYTDSQTQKVSCTDCGIGTYQNSEGTDACLPCETGTFSDSMGTELCSLCSTGRYNVGIRNAFCNDCAQGKHQSSTGQSVCDNCDPGSYASLPASVICVPCSVGKSQAQTGQGSCDDCNVGKFQSNAGQVGCINCIPGTVAPLNGQSVCDDCEPGFYQLRPTQDVCRSCEAGRYTDLSASSDCFQCEPGKYNYYTAQTVCSNCNAGFAQPSIGQTYCIMCSAGTYAGILKNLTFEEYCLDCSHGIDAFTVDFDCGVCNETTFTLSSYCDSCIQNTAPATTGEGCGVCSPRRGCVAVLTDQSTDEERACEPTPLPDTQTCWFSNSVDITCEIPALIGQDECIECQDGAVTSLDGANLCYACDRNAITNDEKTKCLCAPGYAGTNIFNDQTQNNETTCDPCPVGSVCDQYGTMWVTMEAAVGYWESEVGVFYRCLIPQNCLGGSGQESCANLNRTGPLCAFCMPGYTESSTDGSCEACRTGTAAIGFSVFILICAFIIFVAMYQYVLETTKDLLDAADTEDEMVRRLENEEKEDLDHEEDEDITSTEFTSGKGDEKFDLEMRRTVETLRYGEYISIDGPPAPKPETLYKFKIMITFIQIFTNLSLNLQINYPAAFIAFCNYFSGVNLNFVQFASVDCITDVADYYFEVYSWMAVVPFLCLCVWIAIIGRDLLLQKCCRRKDINEQVKKRHRREFWRLIMYTLFLVYPAVSSSIFGVWVCQKYLYEGEIVNYLVADFHLICHDAAWYQATIIALIGLAVYTVGIPLFFYIKMNEYVKGKTGANRLDQKGVRCQLGFLYDGFERRAWYFELVDMLHKLMALCLIPFFPASFQLPMAMILFTVYLQVLLLVNPYLRKGDDGLHLIAQVELILILMAGNCFEQELVVDPTTDLLLSITLILMISGFFVWWISGWVNVLKKTIDVSTSWWAVCCREKLCGAKKLSELNEFERQKKMGHKTDKTVDAEALPTDLNWGQVEMQSPTSTEATANKKTAGFSYVPAQPWHAYSMHRSEITSNKKRALVLAQGVTKRQLQNEIIMYQNKLLDRERKIRAKQAAEATSASQ